MKVRQLLEFTVDITKPVSELTETISAVISAIPDAEQRAEVLRQLDDVIVKALVEFDEAQEADQPAEAGS
ncbi:hypothetical protein D1872_278970 [compost metagenome]